MKSSSESMWGKIPPGGVEPPRKRGGMIDYPYVGNFQPVPEPFRRSRAARPFGAARHPSVAPGNGGFPDPTLTVERMLL